MVEKNKPTIKINTFDEYIIYGGNFQERFLLAQKFGLRITYDGPTVLRGKKKRGSRILRKIPSLKGGEK